MSRVQANISDGAARTVVGPGVGWQDTATAGNQYLDLSDAIDRYVRITATEDTYMCFVPDQSTPGTTSDTGDVKTENLAFTAKADVVYMFAVSDDAPHLWFKQVSSAGVVSVHIS